MACVSPVSAQLLPQFRNDVRAPRPHRDNDAPRTPDESDDCDDEDWFAGYFRDGEGEAPRHSHGAHSSDGIPLDLVLPAVLAPWILPIAVAHDDYQRTQYDLPFPYVDRSDGYLTLDPSPYIWPSWSVRTHVDYGTNLEHLSFINARAIAETQGRWGLDSEVRYWQENVERLTSDQLWTGDVNLVFRFARSERLLMRTGVGSNWLSDQIGSDFGFNFTYGGDWFPRSPWVISGDLDWGTIGRTELFHVRTTVGLCYCPLEVFTGYDYFDATSFRVHGLVGGLRLWF